jgi:hypothetical protein
VRSSTPSATSATVDSGIGPFAPVPTGSAAISAGVVGSDAASTVSTWCSAAARPTARTSSLSARRSATCVGVRCAAASAAGSRMTSISRWSPPWTSTEPTPSTRVSAGLTTSTAASRSARGSASPVTLKVTMGSAVGVTRSTVMSAVSGSSPRASATWVSTSCRVRHMSVPGSNCADSSVAPRIVRARRRRRLGTVATASSSGRAATVCTTSGGRSPTRQTTTMRGKSTSG